MYFTSDTIAYLNGQYIKAADAQTGLFSQTLHYGNGVFEGIRSYSTAEGPSIFKAAEHFERLKHSAQRMNIPFDYDIQELIQVAYRLLKENRLNNAYIRPLLFLGPNMSFRRNAKPNLFIATWQWGKMLGDNLLNVKVSSYERPSPKSCHIDAKVTGHYVNSSLATNEALKEGFDEALMLDSQGFIAQGPSGNFFFEKDNKLFAPTTENVFPGITRSTIIQLAKEADIEVIEKNCTIGEVGQADAAFFTGTAVEVAGVASINNKPLLKDWEDTKSYYLFCKYNQLVRQNEHNTSTVI